MAIFGSSNESDWEALGRYLSRVRQSRRRMKQDFIHRQSRLQKVGLESKRVAWRRSGGMVCRHGVFFSVAPTTAAATCPCLNVAPPPHVWRHAAWMTVIDNDLKKLVVTRFRASTFQRLGVLRAEMIRRGW
eukprot:7491540-Karenia_brevis.AAC.1